MVEIIWSPTALSDADSIAEYIARDSVERAFLFVRRLFDAVEHLQDFPCSGRIIPEINDANCREIIYGAYRIMYRIEYEQIWITGIIHGAREWKAGS
ncbi:MAG: type II toxin-antitoxin system RelE/ParE family toxin [Candidatus Omnitrophota bacterium]|jgi:plasmid stabilization system protein ParE|nr:MAG: type II toxin-antitoxin system RelE/ParE family toxin [Candidatus Omnitrophota bacterium]